jgi:radical SAM superfamily enzyme YgiQ (UPF0313 family)
MRIAFYKPLIRPKFTSDPFKSHYLGFSCLRAYLLAHEPDHDVRVVGSGNELAASRAELIGISCVSEMWEIIKATLRRLRADGFEGPIVLGGPHVTAVPETLPPEADCAVLGEGEASFLDLVRAYAGDRSPDLADIPGVAFRDSDGALVRTARRAPLEMDRLPVDVAEHAEIWLQISTVRGCPFHCPHCVERPTQGRPRYLSAERLLWLMAERLRRTGNRDVFFQDDTFLAGPRRLAQLHERMAAADLLGAFNIRSVSLNANLVKPHTVRMLKEIGVRSLGVGMESLNPRMLGVMKAGIVTLPQIERTLRLAAEAELPIGGSQVYGMRGERADEMLDSIRRVREYEQEFATFRHWVCYACQPLPGSTYWQLEQARGTVSAEMDFSTLRIDGDWQHFASPWFYANDANVPRDEFVAILEREGMCPYDFFRPPRPKPREAKAAAV